MPKRKDYDYLNGTKINRITILKEVEGKKFIGMRAGKEHITIKRACLCRCECGKEWETSYSYILTGKSKSCGCWREEKSHEKIKHGSSRRGAMTKEYRAWVGIISRVTHKSNKCYPNYGGRGIKVCDKWLNDFSSFLNDVGFAPSEKHSIDRINVNGNYEPGNCKWSTDSEQARNKRGTRYFEFNGEVLTINGWSEKTGIPYYRLKSRLVYSNWPIEKALAQ